MSSSNTEKMSSEKLSSDTVSAATASKMNNMNNENPVDEVPYDAFFGIPDLESVTKFQKNENSNEEFLNNSQDSSINGMMEMCSDMDMFPPMPVIASEEEIGGGEVVQMEIEEIECYGNNNQMDEQIVYQNPEKIYVQFPNDPTLTLINGGTDEKELFEEPVYEDLTNAAPQQQYNDQQGQQMVPSYDQQQQQFYGQQMEEYQPDQKEDFAQYMQEQQPIGVYRTEIVQPQQYLEPYHLEEKKIYHLEDPKSQQFLPSPSPSYNSSCAQSPINSGGIDAYFPRGNNTNVYLYPTRSRKSSIASSCASKLANCKIGKVCNQEKEKTFRKRATKADMNNMTPEQKIKRKQDQNCKNAKACVLRKNNNKTEMSQRLPQLETNFKIMEHYNKIQENGLLEAYAQDIYPQDQNNAPFGHPNQFIEELENGKMAACEEVQFDNNGIEILEKKYIETKKIYEDMADKKCEEGLLQNTFASRKSRAKTTFELAQLHYKTQCIDIKIEQAHAIGKVLEGFTKELNRSLMKLGQKTLPEAIVYVGLKQFEPS